MKNYNFQYSRKVPWPWAGGAYQLTLDLTVVNIEILKKEKIHVGGMEHGRWFNHTTQKNMKFSSQTWEIEHDCANEVIAHHYRDLDHVDN